MNAEHATILRIVARDIENLLLPEIASPSLRFVGGAMKTLLERIAYAGSAPATAEPSVESTDWQALIAFTEEQDRAQLAGEQTSRSDGWSQSGSGQVKASGSAIGIRTKPIGPDTLLPYLHERGGFEWVQEARVDQAPGGFSKDTFLVRLSGEAGRRGGMVLRRDQAFRPLLTSVADEAGILTTLSQAGLPVPTPLWLETDPQYFGAAVLATSLIDGSADEKRWSTDPARAQRVLADAAQLLAKLHAFPLEAVSAGSGVPGSRGDTPAAMVEDIRGFWKSIRPVPNPLMERVLDWLAANAPQGFARRSIVHSDFGFHNLMVHEDCVVGLLDWEFWHIGDPREDLAYTRSFVERVMPWDDFRKIYEAAGGVASDVATDRFYSVLGGLRVAMGCYALQHAVQSEPGRLDSKMVYVGQSFAHRFLIDAARAAAGAVSE